MDCADALPVVEAAPQIYRTAMHEPATASSWDEYLALDDASEERHEFIDGQVFAMGGASLRHNRIVGNAAGALDRALRGRPCVALAGAQRVYVEATQMATYPDATVICGRPLLMPDGRTLLNPSLLVEVLSPSTADYDRGAKLRHFMRMPSFVEYLVIATDERRVEHHRRLEPGQWLMREYADDSAVIELPVLDTSVMLADLYDRADELE